MTIGTTIWASDGGASGLIDAALLPILQTAATAAAAGPGIIAELTILTLAIFLGFELISKVPPTLHTPLMSGSNAISGITVIGAVICAGRKDMNLAEALGFLAVVLATINVVGGFLVTNRMLVMFRKKKPS